MKQIKVTEQQNVNTDWKRSKTVYFENHCLYNFTLLSLLCNNLEI